MLSVVGIGLRALLLLIAALVLGLSVTLAKHQVVGPVPPETGFSTFAGAFAFFASLVGMMALWFDRIDGKVVMGVDALATIFYLAASISLTVAMKSVSSCTATDQASQYNRVTNRILSGGCVTVDGRLVCPHAVTPDGTDLTPNRCGMAQADYVWEYVGFAMGIVMICTGYLLSRRGRGGTPTAGAAYN